MNYIQQIIKKLNNGENVFLTGGAGVGKTTTTKAIIDEYEAEAKKVAKLASTAMAATLINGQTIHSFFDFGLNNNIKELEQSTKFHLNKKVKKLLFDINLIVIDEISMVSNELLDMIELRLFQAEFKGSLLVVGDFLQLPPVTRGFNEIRFAFESSAWKRFAFSVIELTHIYRTDDAQFIELLSRIRVANINEESRKKLFDFVKPISQDISTHTLLFGKNVTASQHNAKMLRDQEGELFVKEAKIIKHQSSIKDSEIDKFFEDARVDKYLELKIGVSVLFTRNSWGFYNGERGVVVNSDDSFVYVKKSNGVIIKLEQAIQSKSIWIEKGNGTKKEIVEEVLFSIYQYPIRLAYAITIHKSQGMSIEDLIICTNEIFAPSQFYVAISRASNPKRLTLIEPKRSFNNIIFVNQKALLFYEEIKRALS